MTLDLAQQLNNRINAAVNRLAFLKQDEKVHVQLAISNEIRNFIAEKGDPFKTLTESLGPTFNKIKGHEKILEALIDEMREVSTGFGKMVKKTGGVYPNITVRGNSRIVLKEVTEGTVLRKTVYLSTRGVPCPECEGTGHESLLPGKAKDCKHCKDGIVYPVKGIMLEVI